MTSFQITDKMVAACIWRVFFHQNTFFSVILYLCFFYGYFNATCFKWQNAKMYTPVLIKTQTSDLFTWQLYPNGKLQYTIVAVNS